MPVDGEVLEGKGAADDLEPFTIRLNRIGALDSYFYAFSSREPVSTSLENALMGESMAAAKQPGDGLIGQVWLRTSHASHGLRSPPRRRGGG